MMQQQQQGYKAPAAVMSNSYSHDDPFAGIGIVPHQHQPFQSSTQQRQQQQHYGSADNNACYQAPTPAPTPSLYQQHQPYEQQQAQNNNGLYQSPTPPPATSTASNGMFMGLEAPSPAIQQPPTMSSNYISASSYSAPTSTGYSNNYGMNNPPSADYNNSSSFGTTSSAASQSQSFSSSQQQQQPPPINGMFLGLEPPPPPVQEKNNDNDDDEDPDIRRAREAALYAEGLLEEEMEKRKQEQAKGPLGFGILPKAQGLFSVRNNTPMQKQTATAADATGRPPSPKCDIHVDDVIVGPSNNNNDDRPPWFSSSSNNNANQTVDYGVSGNSNSNGEQPKTTTKSAAVMGASVVGGVAGLVVLGPLAGVVAAGGAAYAAGTREGALGNAIRSTGGLVAKAGSAAKKFEDEHGVVSKTASGVAKGVGWIAKQTMSSKNP